MNDVIIIYKSYNNSRPTFELSTPQHRESALANNIRGTVSIMR